MKSNQTKSKQNKAKHVFSENLDCPILIYWCLLVATRGFIRGCHHTSLVTVFTARKRSLRRLCFYRCMCVHGRGEGVPGQVAPWAGTPQAGTPQACIPQAGTPPRYVPSQACTSPSWQVHPPGRYTSPGRYIPLLAGTPPGRYTPGRYTPSRYTPCHSSCWDMVNRRVVRIPLECILVTNIFT